MYQDIRRPLGLTFLCTGLLLAGYGAWTRHSGIYAVSAGVNLNLIWGVVMAAFGSGALALSRIARSIHRSRQLPKE